MAAPRTRRPGHGLSTCTLLWRRQRNRFVRAAAVASQSSTRSTPVLCSGPIRSIVSGSHESHAQRCGGARPRRSSAGARPAQITIAAGVAGDDAIIEVADTGPRRAAERACPALTPFASSSRPGGSGLGLAIAADLVRAHGGQHRTRARGGRCGRTPKGATFRITLPQRRRPAAAGLSGKAACCHPPLESLRKPSILGIDLFPIIGKFSASLADLRRSSAG